MSVFIGWPWRQLLLWLMINLKKSASYTKQRIFSHVLQPVQKVASVGIHQILHCTLHMDIKLETFWVKYKFCRWLHLEKSTLYVVRKQRAKTPVMQ